MFDAKLIICRISGHRPDAAPVWNDGYHFGRCARCECELIRGKGAWQPVPKGFRVAWKPRRAGDVVWADWTPVRAITAKAGNPVHDLCEAIELRIVSAGDVPAKPARRRAA